MKNTNKLVVTLFSTVLALTALVGCKKQNNNSGDLNPAYDGGKVTIEYLSTAGKDFQTVLNQAVEDFKELYPNITVNNVKFEGDYDGLRDDIATKIGAGGTDVPDIAACYPDHVALYNKSGVCVPFDDYMNNAEVGFTQEQKDDFYDCFWNEGKTIPNKKYLVDGKMYQLPLAKSTECLYYNKTFFEAHQLNVPTTWDEMEQVCEAIKAIDPNSTPLYHDSPANWFITLAEQYGYEYTTTDAKKGFFTFDNDGNKSLMKKLATWYQKGYIDAKFTKAKKYGNTYFYYTEGQAGKCYMSIGSTAGASNYNKYNESTCPIKVGVAMVPQNEDTTMPKKVISQGPGLCMFSHKSANNERRLAASWLFVKYLLTDKSFLYEYAKSGYLPPLESMTDYEYFATDLATANDTNCVSWAATQLCIDMRDNYFVSAPFYASAAARTQAGNIVAGVVLNSVSNNTAIADSALDELINNQFSKALEEARSQL